MILKMYEEFKSNQEIKSICAQYDIENYTINPDEYIDVYGDVYLGTYKVTKLP